MPHGVRCVFCGDDPSSSQVCRGCIRTFALGLRGDVWAQGRTVDLVTVAVLRRGLTLAPSLSDVEAPMITPTPAELADRIGAQIIYYPEARKDQTGKYLKPYPERVIVRKVLPKGRGALVCYDGDNGPGWPAKLHELRLVGGF